MNFTLIKSQYIQDGKWITETETLPELTVFLMWKRSLTISGKETLIYTTDYTFYALFNDMYESFVSFLQSKGCINTINKKLGFSALVLSYVSWSNDNNMPMPYHTKNDCSHYERQGNSGIIIRNIYLSDNPLQKFLVTPSRQLSIPEPAPILLDIQPNHLYLEILENDPPKSLIPQIITFENDTSVPKQTIVQLDIQPISPTKNINTQPEIISNQIVSIYDCSTKNSKKEIISILPYTAEGVLCRIQIFVNNQRDVKILIT